MFLTKSSWLAWLRPIFGRSSTTPRQGRLITATPWKSAFTTAQDTELSQGARFRFTTFGFPIEPEVMEYVPPTADLQARVAWHGWVEGGEEARLDVHHAWLIEDLPGGRVRILTQETQVGKPAQELARTKTNPMLNAHQEWIDGLANAAAQRKRF